MGALCWMACMETLLPTRLHNQVSLSHSMCLVSKCGLGMEEEEGDGGRRGFFLGVVGA